MTTPSSAAQAIQGVNARLGGSDGRVRPHAVGEGWSGGQRIALATVTGGDATTGYTVAVVNWRDLTAAAGNLEAASGLDAKLFSTPPDTLSVGQDVLLLWTDGFGKLPVLIP